MTQKREPKKLIKNSVEEDVIQAAPMVQWVGGKRRLAPHILPMFPDHSCYVEPFAGAAALFFLKEPVKVEVLNDVNGDLVSLYRVVQHHLEEFIRHFKWALASREIYKWLQITPVETLTDIQRAARFFYLQKLGFGGKVQGQTFGTATTSRPALNLLRLEEQLSAVHLRLHQVFVEHLSWANCLTKYDRPHSHVLHGPTLLGHGGLRRRVRPGAIRPDGLPHGLHEGQGGGQRERHPRDA
jgi:DNA adenine methylase